MSVLSICLFHCTTRPLATLSDLSFLAVSSVPPLSVQSPFSLPPVSLFTSAHSPSRIILIRFLHSLFSPFYSLIYILYCLFFSPRLCHLLQICLRIFFGLKFDIIQQQQDCNNMSPPFCIFCAESDKSHQCCF